jgi:hypothetical protein
VVAFAPIIGINAYRTFVLYPDGLPNHNAPFGRIVAEYIDAQLPDTNAYVLGSRWGEWEQPYQQGITYALRVPRQVHFIDPQMPPEVVCAAIRQAALPAVLIWAPNNEELDQALAACLPGINPQTTISPVGGLVFKSVPLSLTP